MTYSEFNFMLEQISFKHREGYLSLKLKVLELSLDGSTSNWNNILWHRFAQNDRALLFPELIEIYKMRDLCYCKKQTEDYEKELSSIGDLLCSDRNIENIKDINEYFNQIKQKLIKILRSNAKSLYDDIRQKVGDAIFEDIRYDLNPRLGKHIVELYNIMQNEVGNLFDKKTFIEATKFSSPDEIKLLINIYLLAIHYDELNLFMEDVAVCVGTHQFENLYAIYVSLIAKSSQLLKANAFLEIIENEDQEVYNLDWIENSRKLNRACMPDADNSEKSQSPDARKLYIIINSRSKFKNKEDNKGFVDANEIYRQVNLAKKRFASFGTESMTES